MKKYVRSVQAEPHVKVEYGYKIVSPERLIQCEFPPRTFVERLYDLWDRHLFDWLYCIGMGLSVSIIVASPHIGLLVLYIFR